MKISLFEDYSPLQNVIRIKFQGQIDLNYDEKHNVKIFLNKSKFRLKPFLKIYIKAFFVIVFWLNR